MIDGRERASAGLRPGVDDASLPAGPVASIGREDSLNEPGRGRRCIVEAPARPLEEHSVARPTDRNEAVAHAVHGEERVSRRRRHDSKRSRPLPMQDRACRADDPHLVGQAEDLEEARKLPAGDPWEIERKRLFLEPACMVVPDESVSAARAPDRVEVFGVLAPDTIDRLSTEPGRGHSLEALTVETEHRRARPRHQDGTVRKGLHPPEIAAPAGVQLFPRLPVEMENERPLPLVGSHRIDIGRRATAHREQGRRELAREELPFAIAGSRGRRRLFAGAQHDGRDDRQESDMDDRRSSHGPTALGGGPGLSRVGAT